MAVLITGAAGFIGSHLSDTLLQSGEKVVALDNFDPFYPRASKLANLSWSLGQKDFRLIEGDIRDPVTLEKLPADISAIVHLAAKAGVRPSIADPEGYVDVNILGTQRLLHWAKQRGVRTFLFASSSSVYGNNQKTPFSESDPVDRPISPYAATKKAGELICHTATHLDGITTLCLRFFTVFGPRQRPDLAIHKFSRLLEGDAPIPMYGDGSSARDYTYITDIVDGIVKGLAWARQQDSVHEIVNLGNSHTVTLSDMIATLAGVLGREPKIDTLPMQPGDVRCTFADISKAARLLAYEPSTDFAKGVRLFVAWFRDRRLGP